MRGAGVNIRGYMRGFTLLELCIVLLIISLVTGMAIMSGISVVSTARISATQQRMKAIDEVLLQYRNANGRLPCPADLTIAPGGTNYGLEAGADAGSSIAVGTGVCTGAGMLPVANFTANGVNYITVAEGAVPVTTLGLANDFMYDGWGNHFRYSVNVNMTALNAFALTPAPLVCGNIKVNDANGSARSGGPTGGAIYGLISHGANGHGAYSKKGAIVSRGSDNANELINCHCNSSGTNTGYHATYVQAAPWLDPSDALDSFDDMVLFREYWQTQTDAYPLPTPISFTLYTDDALSGPLYVFKANGSLTQLNTFGIGYGFTNTTLNAPYGIAVDASGNVWVADTGDYWVEEYSASGSYIGYVGYYSGVGVCPTQCAGNGYLRAPWGVAFDATGNIWVTDGSNNRVQEFTSSGTWKQTIPSTCFGVTFPACAGSSANGSFNSPKGIAIDSNGNIWVADNGNNRIEEFNSSGTYVTSIGAGYNGISGAIGDTGSGSGQFNQPEGITIDASNNIWVADRTNNRVQELNSTGVLLNAFGAGYNGVAGPIGTAGSNGKFTFPHSVAVVASTGLVFVVDNLQMQAINLGSLLWGCSIYTTTSVFGRFDFGHYVAVTTGASR